MDTLATESFEGLKNNEVTFNLILFNSSNSFDTRFCIPLSSIGSMLYARLNSTTYFIGAYKNRLRI